MCPKQSLESCQKLQKSSKKKTRLHSTFPRRNGYSPLQEEREFVVDSGASMHMVSWKDLNSAELETMRTSWSPTTVMTANGEVQTREEATVHVKELDLFVTMMLLEETPAILSLGKLCDHHGYTHHWTSVQKTHLTKNRKKNDCHISNYVPFVVPGLSASSSSTTPSPTSHHLHHNGYTENTVPERSGSMRGELRETRCMNQPKKKKENQKKNKEIYRMNCLIGYRNSERIWLMRVLQQSLGETQSRKVKTRPSHLMNFQWSCEQKWNRDRVNTVYIRTCRRIRIAMSAWRRK